MSLSSKRSKRHAADAVESEAKMRLLGPINSGLTTGGAGTSTSNADTVRMNGRMCGVCVRYNDSPPATTDVVIKTKGTAAPSITFLTLTNKNTDGWFFPRVIPDDLLGVDLAALAIAEPIPFDDVVNIAIAQANDGDSIDIWLLVD